MSSSGAAQKPSLEVEPTVLTNRHLKSGFLLLNAAATGNYENEVKGEFVNFYKAASMGRLPIMIRIESDGTLQSKEGAAANAAVVKTGIVAHTDYMILQDKVLTSLDMIPKIDKAKPFMLYANINLASDLNDPMQVAWAIAHEITVHAMPLCKHHAAVIEAISQSAKSAAVAVGASAAAAEPTAAVGAVASVAPSVADAKSDPAVKAISALEKLLAVELNPDTQHIMQVKLLNQDYIQAWQQMVQHANNKYSDKPAVLQKINNYFEADIVGYYRALVSDKNGVAQDQEALKTLVAKMGGENLLKLSI